MKFKLVENTLLEGWVLNEDTLYKVSYYVGKNKLNDKIYRTYYFLGADRLPPMNTLDDVCEYMHKLKQSSHECVNMRLVDELENLGPLPVSVQKIDEYRNSIVSNKMYVNRMLNTTFSTARSNDHKQVVSQVDNGTPKLTFSNLIVHHLDGTEANNNAENKVGLDGDALHKLAHKLPVVSRGDGTIKWSGRVPSAIYDSKAKGFVVKPCRVTMEIR